jgi:MbtH protein
VDSTEEDDREYVVVLNGEDQYSIWLAYKALPTGWETIGVKGTKATCLEYIEERWTDMRPRSVRETDAGRTGVPPT